MSIESPYTPVFPAGTISPIVSSTTRVQHGLLSPMRDGARLSVDLIRPDISGPLPVVLVRTPYDKVGARANPALVDLAQRGYIIALQDTRGRFNSDGEFFPYKDDRADGYDTVEWVAAQEWCDGNIGMAGGSYVGQTQWFAAADDPPHLKCIVPVVSPPDAFFNEPICNGCFLLPMGDWMVWMGRRSFQVGGDDPPLQAWREYYNGFPASGLAERAGSPMPWWDEMMQHPNLDDLWRACSYMDAWRNVSVPALNISGWWDMNFPGTPMNFAGMREYGKTPEISAAQKMIIGPWPHRGNRKRALNGIDFGAQAMTNLDAYIVRFYDRYLKGIRNGVEDDPASWLFVIGANEWWTSPDWPLPDTDFTPFYFHSNGSANSLKGEGGLSAERPGHEPSDAYRYDPLDPAGEVWDIESGPVDDRLVSIRDDVLCYTSEVLSTPLTVLGPVTCVLYASSSARDTDWHVRLCDVHPDGSARFLCHGMLRARFRESFEQPVFMQPGEIYRFEFSMDAAGVQFQPGHRIRVEVTSSWFPEYDRNTNSGADNNFTCANPVVATQRIFHDAAHPSHVLLPVQRQSRAVLG